jgi:hypothetical protein
MAKFAVDMGVTPPLGRPAPGGRFFPARMPNGQNVLVQTLPLRPVNGAAQKAARDAFEQSVALATNEAIAAGDSIFAHRAVGTEERALVWLLPMAELARPKIRTPQELLGLGLGLLTQISERHQRGLTTPLLSEHTITARGRLAGAQVFATGPWLAEDVEPIRVAPEERIRPTATGDLWRLGHTLSELAREFALPSEVSRLVHPDPKRRPTVTEAIEQFDAAFARSTTDANTVAAPIDDVLSIEQPADTSSQEADELDFAEPIQLRSRSWVGLMSLALAGLSAGALLSLFPG